MIHLQHLFALPAALFTIILSQTLVVTSQETAWPYNIPSHIKYYPQDEVFVKKNLEIQQKALSFVPTGIRKMSSDPEKKFFFDFWHFQESEEEELDHLRNMSSLGSFETPLNRHIDHPKSLPRLRRLLGSSLFEKRDFVCPVGSEACTSINRPNSCCATGSTCQIVPNNGLGDVGCCPADQVCGGSVSTCPSGGYTSCPQDPGGGCCLPGYACLSYGCVAVSTAVVTVVPTTSTASLPPTTVTQTTITVVVPPSSTTSSSTSSPSTSTIVSTSVSVTSVGSTVTTVITATSTSVPASTSATSIAPNILVCSSGFRSCPVSLGGGCCPTDRACGRDVCPEITTTGSFTAPGRPTSSTSPITTRTTTASFASVPGAGCPTGFYACSAYYGGGCCQTGRDCAVSSCPSGASITVFTASGISVIAPIGSGISSVATILTGVCAKGWTTCASDVGGGCCPSGFACGTACTATATAGQGNVVGKIAPQSRGSQIQPMEGGSNFALLAILLVLMMLA